VPLFTDPPAIRRAGRRARGDRTAEPNGPRSAARVEVAFEKWKGRGSIGTSR
jgi:hypothetical protein